MASEQSTLLDYLYIELYSFFATTIEQVQRFLEDMINGNMLTICRPILRSSPHWGRDKMSTILRTTFSNSWSCMKIVCSYLNCIQMCFHGPDSKYSSIDAHNGLTSIRRQAITWINEGLLWCLYMRHLASMNQMRHLTLMHFNTTLYMTYWIQDSFNNIT